MPEDIEPKKIIKRKKSPEYWGRRVAFETLNRVIQGGGFSNILLASNLNRERLTENDKRSATNLVYGVLRNLTLINEVFRAKTARGALDMSPALLNIGRMAIYEIMFMVNVPQYASVSEYVTMARREAGAAEAGFLNACLRKTRRNDWNSVITGITDPVERTAKLYSHPVWMARALSDAYSIEKTKQILRANNNPQPSYFRVNVKRMSVDDFMTASEYNHRGFEKSESPRACVMFQHGRGGFPAREYESGWLTPQDRSTQFIPYYLALEKGDRVLDLCCGSGIKTSQIVEIAPEGVEVTAVDRFSHKLASLENELDRLGLPRIATVEADITDRPDLGEFNKILLDAPCSNSGTVRRRPEIKYRLREADISELTAVQDKLLDAASAYVSSGGSLVYSTCSILPIENDCRIEGFLYRHPEFESATGEIESSLRFVSPRSHSDKYGATFYPNSTNGCGTYVCALKKKR